MAAESISKLLDTNAELRPLTERLQDIKRLQKRYRTVAPERLAQASRVCAIDGTTVVICAASGPVAAVLRQLAPRLLEALRGPRGNSKSSRDQEVNAIRIEVQVAPPVARRAVRARPELPVEKLEKLAGTLREDSPLRRTLEGIARDQSRRTRSKT